MDEEVVKENKRRKAKTRNQTALGGRRVRKWVGREGNRRRYGKKK